MYTVFITTDAQAQLAGLPLVIQVRVAQIIERLEKWPAVSGAKPLRHNLTGQFRVRTGSFRVVFTVAVKAEEITIVNIDNRKDVYDK